ncbi:hypothetical protein HDU67_008348 [Dinochytrium kinnereticum]|nr:hypothetical protein HDU67_008348 [Dinochytrium kinnereticum]
MPRHLSFEDHAKAQRRRGRQFIPRKDSEDGVRPPSRKGSIVLSQTTQSFEDRPNTSREAEKGTSLVLPLQDLSQKKSESLKKELAKKEYPSPKYPRTISSSHIQPTEVTLKRPQNRTPRPLAKISAATMLHDEISLIASFTYAVGRSKRPWDDEKEWLDGYNNASGTEDQVVPSL